MKIVLPVLCKCPTLKKKDKGKEILANSCMKKKKCEKYPKINDSGNMQQYMCLKGDPHVLFPVEGDDSTESK